MTGALEIKVTISEVATPTLFDALVAVSNPRQRAALLKRLAEDALRGSVPIPHAQVTQRLLTAGASPSTEVAIQTRTEKVPSASAPMEPVVDAEPDFDYAFLAENLNLG